MLLLDSTNIPERLTSFTAECLAVRDNCVASKQADVKHHRRGAGFSPHRPSGPAGFICRGMYPMTDEAGRAFFCLFETMDKGELTMDNEPLLVEAQRAAPPTRRYQGPIRSIGF